MSSTDHLRMLRDGQGQLRPEDKAGADQTSVNVRSQVREELDTFHQALIKEFKSQQETLTYEFSQFSKMHPPSLHRQTSPSCNVAQSPHAQDPMLSSAKDPGAGHIASKPIP